MLISKKNYFILNLIFIIFVGVYCSIGLIIPLQFLFNNRYIKALFIVFALLIILYNLFFNYKLLLKTKYIIVLTLFLIFNIITSLITIKYGYIDNIKDTFIFLIYFYAIYPIVKKFEIKDIRVLFNTFFITISSFIGVGVIVSLIQFIIQIGYSVVNYKNIIVRQGYIEHRLFGIFVDPNFLSVVSIIILLYIGFVLIKYKNLNIFIKILTYFMFICFIIFIVLSGSRTALVALIGLSIIFSVLHMYTFKDLKKGMSILIFVPLIILGTYSLVHDISGIFIHDTKNSLKRTDESSENISNNRFRIWESTEEFIVKKPILGYSSGNWYKIGKEYNPYNYIIIKHYHAHNLYIEILFYNGIVGLLLIAYFVLSHLFKLIKNLNNPDYYEINCFILSTLIVLFITNLFLSSTLYGITIIGFILFFILAINEKINISKE